MVKKILKKCRTMFFTFLAKRQLKQYGRNLTVNHYCRFAGNIRVGDNCHFNGMKIGGGIMY